MTGVLFQGMGAATGVAEDLQGGLFDRLRSLPIRLVSIVTGRVGADTTLVAWGCVRHDGGRLRRRVPHRRLDGRRRGGVPAHDRLRVRLRVALHRHGPRWRGHRRRRRGCRSSSSRCSFVSSAYVPVATMPGWMQGFAKNQPLTQMVNTVRLLTGGPAAQALLGHPLSYYLVPSLLWTAGLIVVFAPLAVWKLKNS